MTRGRKKRTEQSTDKIINKDVFSSLMKEVAADKGKISTISGHIGSRIKRAADNNNLHRGAFALMIRLEKMDEVKRNDFLRHVDLYSTMCSELGFFGAQTKDMFDEPDADESGAETQAEDSEPELTPDEVAAAANEALLSKGIKELPRDDDAELAETVFPADDSEHVLGDDEADIRPPFMARDSDSEPPAKPKRGRKKSAPLAGADAEGSYSAVN